MPSFARPSPHLSTQPASRFKCVRLWLTEVAPAWCAVMPLQPVTFVPLSTRHLVSDLNPSRWQSTINTQAAIYHVKSNESRSMLGLHEWVTKAGVHCMPDFGASCTHSCADYFSAGTLPLPAGCTAEDMVPRLRHSGSAGLTDVGKPARCELELIRDRPLRCTSNVSADVGPFTTSRATLKRERNHLKWLKGPLQGCKHEYSMAGAGALLCASVLGEQGTLRRSPVNSESRMRVQNTKYCDRGPPVELVLARHAEDVQWATGLVQAAGGKLGLTIWNNGWPIVPIRNQHIIERNIPNRGREALPYLLHMLEVRERARQCGEHVLPRAFVFAQASGMCRKPDFGTHGWRGSSCHQRLTHAILSLSNGSRIEPFGFADLEATTTMSMGYQELQSPCWRDSFLDMLGHSRRASDMFNLRNLTRLSYAPEAQFAVDRSAILASPPGWMERAVQRLEVSKPLPWNVSSAFVRMYKRPLDVSDLATPAYKDVVIASCCDAGHTCLPWILERFWAVLLSRPPEALTEHVSATALDQRFDLALAIGGMRRVFGSMYTNEFVAWGLALDTSEGSFASTIDSALHELRVSGQNVSDFKRMDFPYRMVKRWNSAGSLSQLEMHHTCARALRDVSLMHVALPRIVPLAPILGPDRHIRSLRTAVLVAYESCMWGEVTRPVIEPVRTLRIALAGWNISRVAGFTRIFKT